MQLIGVLNVQKESLLDRFARWKKFNKRQKIQILILTSLLFLSSPAYADVNQDLINIEKMKNDLNNPTNTLDIKHDKYFPDQFYIAGIPEHNILSTFTSTLGQTFGTFSFKKKNITYLALYPDNLADLIYYKKQWKEINTFPTCASVMGVDVPVVNLTDIDSFVSHPSFNIYTGSDSTNLGSAYCMKIPKKNGTYTFKLKTQPIDYPSNVNCQWIINEYTCKYSSGLNIKEEKVGQIKIIKSKNKTIIKCEKCVNGNLTLRY